jgi:hypothetical protein
MEGIIQYCSKILERNKTLSKILERNKTLTFHLRDGWVYKKQFMFEVMDMLITLI